jgi:NAD(P)-dependent dehydrogenase (short-subunit alcohol dehydrogenase family)
VGQAPGLPQPGLLEFMTLNNKIALVTGAGRGIGREIARRLSREGASLAVVDVDGAAADRVAEEIRHEGGAAASFQIDISDPAQVDSLMAAVVAEFGRLDILVNNAGIGHAKAFLDIPLAEWEQVLRVNLTGTFLCAQAAARVMARQRAGRIVNVGSISGERGGTGRAAYGASKAGVILLTKVMAVELSPLGISVNCVSPGPTETDQVRQCHDPATREAYHRLMTLNRYADPAEIAAAAVFLVSDDASFISGHILNVDGGFGAAGLILPLA